MPRFIRRMARSIISITWSFLDLLLVGARRSVQPNTLLIIKLDAIGDYVLFRNFLSDIRRSAQYKDWRITVLGWSVWRELAELLDHNLADEWWWIDRSHVACNYFPRVKLYRTVRQRGFAVVFNPCSSREMLLLDPLVRATGAPERYGCDGDLANRNRLEKFIGDRWYTHLHRLPVKVCFEFHRNREMTSWFLNAAPTHSRPAIVIQPTEKRVDQPYLVIFPGTRHPRRQWPADRLAKLADACWREFGWRTMLCGGAWDSALADDIAGLVTSAPCENLCGRTSISELLGLLNEVELAVVGDSAPLHLAAALDVPFVCISTANQLFRFTPYPAGMCNDGQFLFPPQITAQWHEPEKLRALYGEFSGLSASTVAYETVWSAVCELQSELAARQPQEQSSEISK